MRSSTPCRRQLSAVAALMLGATGAGCGSGAGIEFRNGRWYDGAGFQERVFYAVDGVLSGRRPDSVTRVVDLAGGYVIPPFGEAHNHRPDGWPGSAAGHIAQFLEHGVFYVMNPNAFPSMVRTLAGEINHPASLDVVFAFGGLTPPGSHVTELYQRNVDRGVFPDGWTRERLDGEGYVIVRDRADLDAKWPTLLAAGPGFIKVFMGFSGEYEERMNDSAFVGKRGIDPDLVPVVVERAHEAGLRVAAHIETARDFRLAVAAGVDLIAHMPASWRIDERAGYADSTIDRWLLTDADAAEAARRDVPVVAHIAAGCADPTYGRIHRHNLELLRAQGVRLAVGSDSYRETSLREAICLQQTGLFTPGEVLRIVSVTTPQVIFPDRRIGVLADGSEASFLVIDGDPIAEPLFAATGDDGRPRIEQVTGRIRLRVKQGHIFE